MTEGIPECNRCCFCLPLRAGLLAWGYFKVIAGVLIIPTLAYFMLFLIVMALRSRNKEDMILIISHTAIALVTLILFITDFMATIVFIVGGHKKNVHLIRGFYIFCIGEFIVTILLILVTVGVSIANCISRDTPLFLPIFAVYLVTLAIQAYFILLLRSEVIKLKSSGEFTCAYNSAEAQCIMTSKQNEVEIETV